MTRSLLGDLYRLCCEPSRFRGNTLCKKFGPIGHLIMRVLKVLECGWNLFGSCVVLAAYFSSVRSDSIDFGNYAIWRTVYVGVGCGIIAFVHVVWINIPSSVRDLEWLTCMWSTWHGCSVAILEISYFLVLCQPLTANRASPSHIPSEHAYTPLLFAACFVAPRLLPSHGSCCDSCDERGMRSWMWDKPWILTSLLVVAMNAICFFVVVASDTCHPDLSR